MDDAVEEVRRGKAWAAIYLGRNFTVDLFTRLCDGNPNCPSFIGPVTNTTIDGSAVHIRGDVTSELCPVTSVLLHNTLK